MDLYLTGKLFAFAKHGSFAEFPITTIGIFLTKSFPKKIVIFSLFLLQFLQFSHFTHNVLFGTHLKIVFQESRKFARQLFCCTVSINALLTHTLQHPVKDVKDHTQECLFVEKIFKKKTCRTRRDID